MKFKVGDILINKKNGTKIIVHSIYHWSEGLEYHFTLYPPMDGDIIEHRTEIQFEWVYRLFTTPYRKIWIKLNLE